MKALNTISALFLIISTLNVFATDVIRDSKKKKGLYYQIQLLDQVINDDIYNRFETVDQYVTKESDYNFRLGVFGNYKVAKTTMGELKNEGFKNVKVVAYFNRVIISIEDAMLFSNNHLKYEEEMSIEGETISVEELNKVLFENAGQIKLQYKLHLGMYAKETNIPSFDKTIKAELRETKQGFYTYYVGDFNNKQHAIEYRKMLVNAGVSEAVVVPYFNGKRISLMLAEKFEQAAQANMASVTQ